MKRNLVLLGLAVILAVAYVPAVLAQATGTVKGVVKDQQGKPMAGAIVQYVSSETGRKYELKTNNKGEFFSLGVAPGRYTVTLLKDGNEVFHFNGVPVTLDEEQNRLDVDLQKEQQRAAQGQGLSPEQQKQMQEQKEKTQKEQLTVKSLNEKLAAARAAMQAGTPEQAVQAMTEATQIDPNRDLIWFTLGDAYSAQAKKTEATDRAAAKPMYDQAIQAYQKAIAIKPMADYYNNLAQAEAKAGQTDQAIQAYSQAAQIDPTRAAMFYFNEGAVLTNTGKVDDAIEAFKKAIAADPNRADSYYWLGVNMIGKATLQGDKMVAPPGTAEAFNKYLELQPTGQFAEPAKQMLASIGASIETSFGKKKSSKTK
ncbi:MAG TPA: tetratricopeptide repeat protein [Terriglobales bacterium]|nr:tetratricopeptide repeat protein [Terriglobales bacterium]